MALSLEISSNGAVFRAFVHSASKFFVQKVKSEEKMAKCLTLLLI
jgi:hypothetical protein